MIVLFASSIIDNCDEINNQKLKNHLYMSKTFSRSIYQEEKEAQEKTCNTRCYFIQR